MDLYLHPPALPIEDERALDNLASQAPVGTIVLATVTVPESCKVYRTVLSKLWNGNWSDLETTPGWKPEDGKDFGYRPDNVFKTVEGEERAVQLVYLPEN